jgi:hypothetical protein
MNMHDPRAIAMSNRLLRDGRASRHVTAATVIRTCSRACWCAAAECALSNRTVPEAT